MAARTLAAVALAATIGQVAAHSPRVNAATLNRTNWEAEEQIKDATTECSAYDYPPVTGKSPAHRPWLSQVFTSLLLFADLVR